MKGCDMNMKGETVDVYFDWAGQMGLNVKDRHRSRLDERKLK